MTQQQPRIEEQLLSRAAEIGLSSLLDQAETIDVNVHTGLFEIIQGEADSISIVGKGWVIQKDIRLHDITLETNGVDIDTLSAISGKPKLDQPLDATARIVLLEKDINRAFNSEYFRSKMQNFELNVEGETVNLKMQQLEMLLPGEGKMVFNIKALVPEMGKTNLVSFTTTFIPRTRSQPVKVQGFTCNNDQSISLAIAVAMMEKIKQITTLHHFDLGKMAFRLKEMEVQQGCIILQTEAHIREIPSM